MSLMQEENCVAHSSELDFDMTEGVSGDPLGTALTGVQTASDIPPPPSPISVTRLASLKFRA